MPLTTDDVIEIQMLYARYNTAIDTGDGATFGGLFVPDGVFNPGHTLCEGRDAIAEFGIKTHEMMPLMRHNATNIVIDGEGDSATGSAFLIGYIAGADHKVITTGRYQDKLTKTGDGWRFTERVYHADV